jgi:large-conductance mechanosensitive channel
MNTAFDFFVKYELIFYMIRRSEETEKEELVKPEWMNKPKEEMNDEERKLLKEFEKKLAIFKVKDLSKW